MNIQLLGESNFDFNILIRVIFEAVEAITNVTMLEVTIELTENPT